MWQVCNLVSIARAILHLYMSDSPELRDRNWRRFVSNEPVGKGDSLHVKQWSQVSVVSSNDYLAHVSSQWILAELGAPNVLVTLAGYDGAKVKLANIRFGTSLLEGGNKLVQATVLLAIYIRYCWCYYGTLHTVL